MAYFPRGAYYGPQVKDTGVGLLLQLGFHEEHQYGGTWANVREEAIKRLQGHGNGYRKLSTVYLEGGEQAPFAAD